MINKTMMKNILLCWPFRRPGEGGGLVLPIIVPHQHFRRPTSFLQFLDVMIDMHEEYVSMPQNITESELNVSPKFTSLGLLG